MPEQPPPPPSLHDLRASIDRIDTALHDLIMERALVAQQIGARKRAEGEEGIFLRPGREMEVLRRLMERHSGDFPRPVVVRLWREIFSALVALQGPMTLAVYMPERGAGFLELARDHYGAYTPTVCHATPGAAVRAVTEGEATVGILPLPRPDEEAPWWPMLVSDAPNTPRIVARLPLCGPGPGRGNGVEGLAIARLTPDATGDDHSLLVLETSPDISRAGVRGLVEGIGLTGVECLGNRDLGPSSAVVARLHLVEVDSACTTGDTRLAALAAIPQVQRVFPIGVYATPFASL